MIQFRVNIEKAISALHYLMRQANARGRSPSQYDLVKATFLADRTHLNRFGRPVTYDRYVAMIHGPVPSFVYDCLKPNFNWASVYMDGPPWHSVASGKVHRFTAQGDPDPYEKKLSASDRRALADALTTVMSLTFPQIRKLTHEDRAYTAAWRDEEDTFAFPMNMELLLDDADDGALEDIRYLSEMSA